MSKRTYTEGQNGEKAKMKKAQQHYHSHVEEAIAILTYELVEHGYIDKKNFLNAMRCIYAAALGNVDRIYRRGKNESIMTYQILYQLAGAKRNKLKKNIISGHSTGVFNKHMKNLGENPKKSKRNRVTSDIYKRKQK